MFLSADFASVLCSYEILLSEVVKVINVYFELTHVTVTCQLIPALSVLTIQMYLVLFIKIWAIPSCRATTDKKRTSPGMKDGWESLISEMSLSDCHGRCSHSIAERLPASALRSQYQFHVGAEALELNQKRQGMDVYIFPNLCMK